jgi:hypothetical protein
MHTNEKAGGYAPPASRVVLRGYDPGCGTMRMYGLGSFQPFG